VFVAVYDFPLLWMLRAPWRETMLADVISASTILVAYLLTAATILPAVEEKAIIRKLRSWGLYDLIIGYIGRAAYAAAVLLLLSLLAVVLPAVLGEVRPLPDLMRNHDLFNRVFSAFWWSILSLTVGFAFIATRILLRMLRAPRE
jgi:hypothetical protein